MSGWHKIFPFPLFIQLYNPLVIGWHNCKCRECIRLNLKGERTLWDDHCFIQNCNTELYIFIYYEHSAFLPFSCHFFFFFLSCCMACELIVPQPGIEPISAVEVWNSNHWTAREVPSFRQVWSGCVLGHSSGSTEVIGNYWLSPSADSHSLH